MTHQKQTKVATQNETRENEMLVNNEEMIAETPVGAALAVIRGGAARKIAAKAAPTLLLGVAAVTALLFMPPPALADNECGDPDLNGNTDDSFTCPTGDQTATGFTHSSNGNLALEVEFDGFTIFGNTFPTALEVGVNGINTTGNGADNISLGFELGPNGMGVPVIGTAGPIIDYQSDSGNINIETWGITGTNNNVTYGILAESMGGGDITITNPAGSINISSFFGSQENAIRAVTTGGNGDVSITTVGLVTGRSRGIEAETSGTGDLVITASGRVRLGFGSGGPAPVAAIDATTGTGLLSIDIAAGSGAIDGGRGAAILANAGGDAQIDIAAGRTIHMDSASSAAGALDLTAVGTTTMNNAGTITVDNGAGTALAASGGSFALDNTGVIRGGMDFTGMTGSSVVNNTGTVETSSTLTVTDLQAMNNSGTLAIGVSGFAQQGESMTFAGLETFGNSGTIIFGLSRNPGSNNDFGVVTGQIVSAPGAAFTGVDDSTLVMEASLFGEAQESCQEITVADCFDLSGGSTDGETAILITATARNFSLDPFIAALEPRTSPGVVLVDVSGGTGHAGDFVLHPDSAKLIDTDPSEGFTITPVPVYEEDEVYGAVLDTGGLFDYALLYNPDTQQHVLTSVPQEEGVEYASAVQETLSIWHTTSDAVAGRQADLREGAVGGGWARFVNEQTERESAPTLSTHGNNFTYGQDYTISTRAMIAGFDIFSGDSYVFGAHAGVVTSRLEFDLSSTGDRAKGATFGTYGGWWRDIGPGLLTLDGTINANVLKLDHDVSEHENSSSEVKSIGVRAEAGWRLALLDERLYVQPLVTGAYVHANIERLDLRDYDADFDNTDSVRAALGLRLGGDVNLPGERVGGLKYWLTGRAWEEYAGDDAQVAFKVEGSEDLAIMDDLSGGFEEVGLGVSVSTPEDKLNVYLSGGAKFADDLDDSFSVSIGARLRW